MGEGLEVDGPADSGPAMIVCAYGGGLKCFWREGSPANRNRALWADYPAIHVVLSPSRSLDESRVRLSLQPKMRELACSSGAMS